MKYSLLSIMILLFTALPRPAFADDIVADSARTLGTVTANDSSKTALPKSSSQANIEAARYAMTVEKTYWEEKRHHGKVLRSVGLILSGVGISIIGVSAIVFVNSSVEMVPVEYLIVPPLIGFAQICLSIPIITAGTIVKVRASAKIRSAENSYGASLSLDIPIR